MPTTLPSLSSFPTGTQPEPEQFGHALRHPDVRTLHCVCEPQNREAAEIYARVLGIRSKLQVTEVSGGIPYEALADEDAHGVVPLFIDSATNPDLPKRYFGTPRVASFVDHQYIRDPGGADALTLRTIGTTAHGLRQTEASSTRPTTAVLERERSESMKAVMGSDIVTNHDLRQILASPAVEHVRLHALGPQGTNIAQASELYLRNLGIAGKSDLTVHPRGITPIQYAELAAAEKRAGTVPLHMECAVYFGMPKLYQDRVRERMELLFADHQYMPLDEMQLAALGDVESNGHRPRVATHGSPKPLMQPWIAGQDPYAEWVDATSNAAAADMVRNREVEYCITTESGRIGTRDQQELTKIHSFGSPMMVFTLGTPYTQAELRSLRA
jgi:hypothetical protein